MKILATFDNGKSAVYTRGILELLLTDPGIVSIIDYYTGELLFYKGAGND